MRGLLFRHTQLRPPPKEFLALCVPHRQRRRLLDCPLCLLELADPIAEPPRCSSAWSASMSATSTCPIARRPARAAQLVYEWTSWGHMGTPSPSARLGTARQRSKLPFQVDALRGGSTGRAKALNDRKLPTARGGKWTASSVINVRARLAAAGPLCGRLRALRDAQRSGVGGYNKGCLSGYGAATIKRLRTAMASELAA